MQEKYEADMIITEKSYSAGIKATVERLTAYRDALAAFEGTRRA